MKNIINTLKRISNWLSWHIGGLQYEEALWQIDGE